LQTVWVYF